MRKYSDEEKMHLEQVICNACGRYLQVENGIIREGCYHGDSAFGYFSSRDGVKHHFDLCEDCYDKMIENFKVPVEESETMELL